MNPPICLTVAGLDPSGGAGIVADIKTFTAFGCFATAAVASLTFQNTTAVFGALHQTGAAIRGQVEPILNDFKVAAMKTGMLPTQEVIEETAALIREGAIENVVVDPVVRSTSGFDLIDDAALRSLIKLLFPLAYIVTPNIPEAERITEMSIRSESDINSAATIMQSLGAKNVLIKGGHLQTQKGIATDYLFEGEDVTTLDAEYFETDATHGTGCTLAAAIAANLALGNNLRESVSIGKSFVNQAIRTAPGIGSGHSPINIPPIWRQEGMSEIDRLRRR